MDVKAGDVLLCEFYFSDLKQSKKRPVLVLKDNLPFDDFVGIPISSRIEQLQKDEYLLDNSAFAEGGIPQSSKLILRKTFVITKSVVMKRYGTLSEAAFANYHALFCQYFCCGK